MMGLSMGIRILPKWEELDPKSCAPRLKYKCGWFSRDEPKAATNLANLWETPHTNSFSLLPENQWISRV